MTVEALDTLVHTVVYGLSIGAVLTVVGGTWWMLRTLPGAHRSPLQAVDIGHQPAHAAPDRPSRWTRFLEATAAYALLRGVHL